ncbi:GMC oxidoreductase [Streptomyces sp. NPDC051555]|uniref:GMC oxidoreductase n=1 Tax=Streptomyces sp. NPDC051555 TaxID=3365657 RepID=UPI0037AF3D64
MSRFSRRDVLALAVRAGLAGIGTAVLGGRAQADAASSRTRFTAIVVGSGFGGSVAALRLGQAGVDTLVLERGREWPTAPDKQVFGSVNGVTDTMFWNRPTTRYPLLLPTPVRPGPGVLEVSQERDIDILCGAGVGGGSLVYSGVTIAPQRRYFERLYPAALAYREFEETWFPKVRNMLGSSPMPADVYRSTPFTHSRLWDEQERRARARTFALDSTFDWEVIRAELAGRAPLCATIGNSDFGCGNGAKKSLTRSYLPAALASGHVQLRPLHEVRSIHRRRGGGFLLEVRTLDAGGTIVDTAEYSCDMLFMAAGTLNTNRLLVAARERGELPDLPASVGQGFGDNGDQVSIRSAPLHFHGGAQGAPMASAALFDRAFGLPLLAESYMLAAYHGVPAVVTISMTVDTDHRGAFRYDPATRTVALDWNASKSAAAARAAADHNQRVISSNPLMLPVGVQIPTLTAHPVGGCVIGTTTDLEGRVHGMKGLYVIDGSLLPGNAAGANPSLSIAALAERAMANIISGNA